ncbi:VirB4 family type IV secretion system protein [Novispirillum itersonii]|uniref:Type IV secretion system protein VirB4 n=1 Tax=Novispirillum itersonii TaxID=189 RepID=A0A7W9ZFR4_NOVIT|nr:type IV secretion system protein VirB4 [Novispirillum itersonii]MBB6210638.1 type IV secretion system protein VirB4 [Novispirillum itersonii]
MWDDVIATAVVAAGAGAAVIPALRDRAFGTVREDWLADELPFDRIHDGLTIVNKDGSQTRAWAITGLCYDAKLDQEQITLLKGRTALLHDLGKRGLSLRLLAVKRRRPLDVAATWPCRTLAEIGEAEAARYTWSHEIEWFLLASGRSSQALMEADEAIRSTLHSYQPAALRQPEDKTQPCPLTGLLNGLVCGEYRRDLLPLSTNLSGSIIGADMAFDRASGTIRAEAEDCTHMRIISVTQWPDTVSGQMVSRLLSLDADLEISQICEPIEPSRALFLYKREENAQRHSWFKNPGRLEEVEIILERLAKGDLTLFITQMQVIVRSQDPATLESLTRQVTAILGELRVSYAVETRGAPAVWFGRFPEAAKKIPGGKLLRPLTILNQNVAALWTFQHSASGMPGNPFGKGPVRLFRTLSGQVYRFQFHVAERPKSRGNALVFAPTGGGKSTLMMHLLGGFAKWPGVLSVVLDSKEGARYMVEAMGGFYQGYDQLSLNPLDVGADTQQNRQRIYSILTAMCGPMALSPDDKVKLAHAVEQVFHLDPPHRTLTEALADAFPASSELARQFSRWVVDTKGNRGQYAHLLNAPRDSIGSGVLLGHHLVGINMNELLDDPDLGPPVVAHLAQALSQSAAANARGFFIFVDEAAKLIGNPGFASLVKEMYREYRKLGGAVALAFQDPAALLESPEGPAIIDGTATMIFLPNAKARPEDLRKLGLNDEQVAFACGQTLLKPGERQALVIRRDAAIGLDESAFLDVNLAYLGNALRFYDAGTDVNKRLAALKAQWGDQWINHL